MTYTRLDFPVISDRDYVLRVRGEQVQEADGKLAFSQKWTPDNDVLPERSGVVRLRHNAGRWYVTHQGEDRVHFIYHFTVEPGGSITVSSRGWGRRTRCWTRSARWRSGRESWRRIGPRPRRIERLGGGRR